MFLKKFFNINYISYFIATGFYISLLFNIPGTIATIVATCLWLSIFFIFTKYQLFILIIISFFIGIFICHYASYYIKSHDHKSIIWDELVGTWFTIMFLPEFSIKWIIFNFLLFRFFDIIKPWPIYWFHKNIKGGIGIMIDDLVAGILTCLLLNFLNKILF